MLAIETFSLQDVDLISALLQLLQYIGSVAAAGSILLLLSLFANSQNTNAQALLWTQSLYGALLLLIVEPIRVAYLLYGLFDGDWGEALSLDGASLLIEISTGQAGILRFAAATLLLIFASKRMTVAAIVPVILILSSYLMTGHTVSVEHEVGANGQLLSTLLLFHLVLIHWWLAIIWPLLRLASTKDPETQTISHSFGKQALFSVPTALFLGVGLLLNLTNWQLDLTQGYQAWFLVKILLVCGILLIAALNKLRFGKNLNTDHQFRNFAISLKFELLVAILILAATSLAINVGLDM